MTNYLRQRNLWLRKIKKTPGVTEAPPLSRIPPKGADSWKERQSILAGRLRQTPSDGCGNFAAPPDPFRRPLEASPFGGTADFDRFEGDFSRHVLFSSISGICANGTPKTPSPTRAAAQRRSAAHIDRVSAIKRHASISGRSVCRVAGMPRQHSLAFRFKLAAPVIGTDNGPKHPQRATFHICMGRIAVALAFIVIGFAETAVPAAFSRVLLRRIHNNPFVNQFPIRSLTMEQVPAMA